MNKKIIHIIIAAAYKEGFGYQENILPYKHKEQGLDVLIVSYDRFNYYSQKGIDSFPYEYINLNEVRTIIIEKNNSLLRRIPYLGSFSNRTKGLRNLLVNERPDIIFVHGVIAPDHIEVVKYVRKHSNVKLFVDNHNDCYNIPHANFWDNFIVHYYGKYVAKRLASQSEVMWGVTPWRVEFLNKVYGVPEKKIGLLEMGGDENKIDWARHEEIRAKIREQYHIPQNSFLIITGGKRNKTKNIHILIDACKSFPEAIRPYLLIFGKTEKDMEPYFNLLEKSERIIYIGWIPSDDVYPLFLASNLAVFPGTHSVLWEQACASGLPCVFKDWDGGFAHVDVGGNCILIKEPTKESIYNTLSSIIENKDKYNHMKEIAETKARIHFSYCEIAKRSIKYEE